MTGRIGTREANLVEYSQQLKSNSSERDHLRFVKNQDALPLAWLISISEMKSF